MISYHAKQKGCIYYDPEGFIPYEHKTVKDLCSIILEYTWSPIVFNNNKRLGSNFMYSDLCVLDVDNDKIDIPVCTIEQAKEEFCDCKVIIGTTRNHQRSKKGGPIEDRYRVIMAWDKRIHDADQYRASIESMRNLFDFVDKSAVDPGRQFFPCKEIVWVQAEGETIPVQDINVRAHKSQVNFERIKSASRPIPPHIIDFLVDGKIFAGGRNNAIYHASQALLQKGITLTDALQLITEAPFDKSTDFKMSEIYATCGGVYKRAGIVI